MTAGYAGWTFYHTIHNQKRRSFLLSKINPADSIIFVVISCIISLSIQQINWKGVEKGMWHCLYSFSPMFVLIFCCARDGHRNHKPLAFYPCRR